MFQPDRLHPGLLDLALADRLCHAAPDESIPVLLERNLASALSPDEVLDAVGSLIAVRPQQVSGHWSRLRLTPGQIHGLASSLPPGLIHRIWLDHAVRPHSSSVPTVKADAALAAFGASGAGICWAVVDSGIAAGHTHFDRWSNLELPFGLAHRDFSSTGDPLTDPHGHGTHVAAILAGQAPGGELGREPRGIAPRAKVISLRVLDEDGCGQVSQILAALDYVRQANDGGRTIRIHGVNLSVGYDFDPEWYACGQSPLCAEVDRLASSGVVVVVSAGNAGYGVVTPLAAGPARACLPYTISDPGNAEQAITVGSTHRDSPHTYGVSYFSSKGPTGDGRAKPDLVAPGERILSAAAPSRAPQGADWRSAYVEDSGTSMAAPHVSGAVAAFLSVRREFIGLPAEIKRIFLQSATDLRRKPDLQGRGLLNLFEVLQVR